MNELVSKRCQSCEGGVSPMSRDEAHKLLQQVPQWSVDEAGKSLSRSYEFKNYYHTMAFVNAVAWIAHRENHHPDMEVGYKRCRVQYSTHAIGGLSENDFICAAKVDQLLTE